MFAREAQRVVGDDLAAKRDQRQIAEAPHLHRLGLRVLETPVACEPLEHQRRVPPHVHVV